MMITPVLLCGGSGTRLWPLSRKSHPKQFTKLLGEETLFQVAAKRMEGSCEGFGFNPVIVATNADFRFVVAEQLQALYITPAAILIEPEGRNTAASVLAAALQAQASDENAILLVAPSDHVIRDTRAFHLAISRGLKAVEQGRLVTFGITPSHAETAYGYLELAEVPDAQNNAMALKRFVEKPDKIQAEQMLEKGCFKWNAGIFLFRAKDIIAAYEVYVPDMLTHVRAALAHSEQDLGFLRLAPEDWAKVADISIDYAVMEKAQNLSVVPFDAHWSDLGGWDAVWREGEADKDGVVTHGDATAIECKNSMLRSESEGLELVGVGLENILAIAMKDAVLIADLNCAQSVKKVVSVLKEKGAKQATAFSKDYRPWGWFESLAVGPRFQVKKIMVKPKASLSLQSHLHRAEHWIVVEGTAKVTVGGEVQLLAENESTYVPVGAVHRLENPGMIPMVLIEVQTGAYVGEDDITRYEDIYAR